MPFKLKIILLNFALFNFPQESSNLHKRSFFWKNVACSENNPGFDRIVKPDALLGYCLFFKAVM